MMCYSSQPSPPKILVLPLNASHAWAELLCSAAPHLSRVKTDL